MTEKRKEMKGKWIIKTFNEKSYSDVSRDFSKAYFSCAFEAQPLLTITSCFPGKLGDPGPPFCTVLIFKDSEENRAVGKANENPWVL